MNSINYNGYNLIVNIKAIAYNMSILQEILIPRTNSKAKWYIKAALFSNSTLISDIDFEKRLRQFLCSGLFRFTGIGIGFCLSTGITLRICNRPTGTARHWSSPATQLSSCRSSSYSGLTWSFAKHVATRSSTKEWETGPWTLASYSRPPSPRS